jgi:hypoxanthine phosphoribosyltransferase
VRSYSDERVQGEVHILRRDYGHLRGRRVLLIDDLVDSGRTMNDCTAYLLQEAGAALVETAVIYRKAGSQYQPTYYIEEKPRDEWIVFPWEEKQAI